MVPLANRIHHESCLDFMSRLPDGSVSSIVTDPPFGISYQNNYTQQKHAVLQGDGACVDLSTFGKEAYRVLKDNSAIFCFTGWSEYPHHFQELSDSGFHMKEPLICQKRPSGKTDLFGTFQTNSDWIMFGHKGRFKFKKTALVRNKRAGTVPNKGRKPVAEYKTRMPSCWFGEEFPRSTENSSFQKQHGVVHPTIKGLEFIKWLIQLSTDEGDLVLDPFVGSGTTAVACKELGRGFLACDVDQGHCQTAMRRLGGGCVQDQERHTSCGT